MQSIFDKQIDLFELYLKRNIFNPREKHETPSSSSSNHGQLDEISAEVMDFQKEVRKLSRKKRRLEADLETTNNILGALREGLYPLKVAEQTVYSDQHSSFSESLSFILRQREALESLCNESEEVTSQLKEDDTDQESKEMEQSNEGSGIEGENLQDAKRISDSLND